jgi:hypothetical protein
LPFAGAVLILRQREGQKMGILIVLLGSLEMLVGLMTFAVAKTVIHEILSVCAFGFGSITLALGVIIRQLGSRAL